MKKVYFSYAYTTPVEVSEAIKEKLRELGVEVSFYERGTQYSDVPIRECDAFVTFLPNNAVREKISNLSPGIQKELILAYNLKKDIILVTVNYQQVAFYLPLVNTKNGTINSTPDTNQDMIALLQKEPEIQKKSTELDWLNKPETNIIL
jgi:rRNA maturation endonuclease Nob1